MKKQGISKTTVSLLVASALMVSAVVVPAADVSSPSRILGSVNGRGDVLLRGVSIEFSGTVFSGDRIQTGAKGNASVILSNGNRAELGDNTEFVVNQNAGATTHIGLAKGSVGFAASRSPLAIVVGNYEFTPKTGSNGSVGFIGPDTAGISVFRGSLTVKDKKSKQSMVFQGGTQYLLDLKGTGPIAKLVSTMPTLPSPDAPNSATPARRQMSTRNKGLLIAAGAGAAAVVAILVTRDESCEGNCATAKSQTQTYLTSLVAAASAITNPTAQETSIINEIKAVQAELNKSNLSPAEVSALIAKVSALQSQLRATRPSIPPFTIPGSNFQP
jgi:ferric-dicitrate binding protein FerR (iron transport regulator)